VTEHWAEKQSADAEKNRSLATIMCEGGSMSDVMHHTDLLAEHALNKCVPIMITSLDKRVGEECMCSWLLSSCSLMVCMADLKHKKNSKYQAARIMVYCSTTRVVVYNVHSPQQSINHALTRDPLIFLGRG
jgi:hypothetical protein